MVPANVRLLSEVSAKVVMPLPAPVAFTVPLVPLSVNVKAATEVDTKTRVLFEPFNVNDASAASVNAPPTPIVLATVDEVVLFTVNEVAVLVPRVVITTAPVPERFRVDSLVSFRVVIV